jgi:hypothetical protein
MSYLVKMLPIQCGVCGFIPPSVRVGVSTLGELALFWNCQCGNPIVQTMALEEVIRLIPTIQPEEFTEADKKLMAKAHISLGGEDATL